MSTLSYEPCQLREEDARLIMEWRNDPTTLSMALHHTPKVWDSFWKEYQSDYLNPRVSSCGFVRRGSTPVAFLRFRALPADPLSLDRRACDISINVSPKERGKGVGTASLKLSQQIAHQYGYQFVLAEIRPQNKASIVSFERAGFQFMDQIERLIPDTGENCRLLRYGLEIRLPLKAILFDFDGTLANSLAAMKASYFDLLKSIGQSGSEPEFESLNGPPLAQVIESLKSKYGITQDSKTLLLDYQSRIQKSLLKIEPMAGAPEVLKLAKERGLKVAIVTSNSQSAVLNWLTAHQLQSTIDAIVDPSQTKEHKPQPAPYLKALEILKVSPGEALAIEDSEQGARAAILSGVRTYALSHDQKQKSWPGLYRTLFDLRDLMPEVLHYRVESVSEKLQLTYQESTLALSPDAEAQIDRIWKSECEKKPELFNGQILCVKSYARDAVSLTSRDFKYLLAQHKDSTLYEQIQLINLGVTGIVIAENKFVFGKRSDRVTHDPLKWELVPAGTFDKKFVKSPQKVDWQAQILEELFEEVGVHEHHAETVRAFGMIRGLTQSFIDLAIEIKLRISVRELEDLITKRPSREYIDFKILDLLQTQKFLSESFEEISETSQIIFQFWRSHSGRKIE